MVEGGEAGFSEAGDVDLVGLGVDRRVLELCDLPNASALDQGEGTSGFGVAIACAEWVAFWPEEVEGGDDDGDVGGDRVNGGGFDAHGGVSFHAFVDGGMAAADGVFADPMLAGDVDPFDVVGVEVVHGLHVVLVP